MTKKMSRKARAKMMAKRQKRVKLGAILLIIVVIIFSIYNSNRKEKYQSAETATYNKPNKIDKCIVIDAGHGGTEEPGCIFENIYEKNICLQIAEKLQSKLEKEYEKVVMTRTEDVNVYLNERARIANRENADMFVSIHLNSLENDTVTSGIETWYNSTKDTESKVLAQNIQDSITKATGANDIGIKDSNGLIVTKNTEMPSCLVEAGFLSSTEERKKLTNDNYQNKIVEGIYNGIKTYFEQSEDNKNKDGNNV